MIRMKFIRLSRRIRQIQLAKFVGIPENRICKIETGRIIASPDEVTKIAKFLGVDEDVLFQEMN